MWCASGVASWAVCMHAYTLYGGDSLFILTTPAHTSELAHPDTRARRAPLRVSGPRLRGRAVAREHRSPRHRGAAGGGLSPSLDPTSTCHNSQSHCGTWHKHISTKELSQSTLSISPLACTTLIFYRGRRGAHLHIVSAVHKSNGSGIWVFHEGPGLVAGPPPRRPYGSASVSSNLPPSACARASCAASTRSCRVSAATETAHRSRVLRVCSACSLSRGAR